MKSTSRHNARSLRYAVWLLLTTLWIAISCLGVGGTLAFAQVDACDSGDCPCDVVASDHEGHDDTCEHEEAEDCPSGCLNCHCCPNAVLAVVPDLDLLNARVSLRAQSRILGRSADPVTRMQRRIFKPPKFSRI